MSKIAILERRLSRLVAGAAPISVAPAAHTHPVEEVAALPATADVGVVIRVRTGSDQPTQIYVGATNSAGVPEWVAIGQSS